MVLEIEQARILGTSFTIALPAILYYFQIQKDIKKSILFTIVFTGISGILIGFFKAFALEGIIPIANNISFFLWGSAITGFVVFLSFNALSEKVKIQKILFIAGGYILLTTLMLLFVLKNLNVELLMSII